MSDKIREALEGMLAIHDEPSGFAGKYGRALDEAIAAQKAKIDQRIAAARTALAQQPAPVAVPESEKKIAHRKVRNAIKRGDLERPSVCSRCGEEPKKAKGGRAMIHAHHHDYQRPLDVEWICARCHREETPLPKNPGAPARGESNGQSKLSEKDVIAARRLRADGLVYREIADRFGVNKRTIMRAIKGQQWAHIESAAAPAAPVAVGQEPVAWLFQHEETGLTQCADNQQVEWGFEQNNPRWQKIAPLYAAPPAAEQPTGTTSDKYRAELYDEVWEKACGMGYGNVTEALVALERMKAAKQPCTVVVPMEALRADNERLRALLKQAGAILPRDYQDEEALARKIDKEIAAWNAPTTGDTPAA